MHIFDKYIEVSQENIELFFKGFESIDWLNFLLNPRRLRGSDFLMRWSQGVWSENRLIAAINQTNDFFATAYGPSSTAPSDNVREFEIYFERLEHAGLAANKRPDLLIFKKTNKSNVLEIIKDLGGEEELAFLRESDMSDLLDLAICGIECENSLWVAEKMPCYGEELRPMKRLNGKPGLPKNAVLPTVIIKDEDLDRLLDWEKANKIPIHVWHVFYDKAYGLSLKKANKLISDGLISATEQVFQAPGGATTKKNIYKFYYHYAYLLGKATSPPKLESKYIEDANGHILPYVHFSEGRLEIDNETIDVLNSTRNERY